MIPPLEALDVLGEAQNELLSWMRALPPQAWMSGQAPLILRDLAIIERKEDGLGDNCCNTLQARMHLN